MLAKCCNRLNDKRIRNATDQNKLDIEPNNQLLKENLEYYCGKFGKDCLASLQSHEQVTKLHCSTKTKENNPFNKVYKRKEKITC